MFLIELLLGKKKANYFHKRLALWLTIVFN